MDVFPNIHTDPKRPVIFIPCFNCELQIPRTLADLRQQLFQLKIEPLILILDNGSSDQTIAAARTCAESDPWLKEKVCILKNIRNIGLGGSHKVALLLATQLNAERLIVFHGDHQSRATDLLKILEYSCNTSRTVIGSRFSVESKRPGYPYLRTLGNKMLNFFYTIILGYKVEDVGAGLSSYSVADCTSFDLDELPNDFTFNMALTIKLISKQLAPIYVPIHWEQYDQKSNAKIFSIGAKSLLLLIRHFLGFNFEKEEKINVSYTHLIYGQLNTMAGKKP